MKKLLFTIILIVFCSATFTSCIEENIEPQIETGSNGGGSGQDPIKP